MLRHDPTHQSGLRPRLLAVEQLESRRPLAVLAGVDVPLFQPGGAIFDTPTPGTGIPGTASIAGTVFEADGLVAPLENMGGMAGVTVRLLDNEGQFVTETTTGAGGGYEFTGLDAGWYGVLQVQPAGYSDGRSMQGTGGGVTLSPNLIGDINLATGAALIGYDFADVKIAPPPGTMLQPLGRPFFLPVVVDALPVIDRGDAADDAEGPFESAPALVAAAYQDALPKLEVEPAGVGGSGDERLRTESEKTDNTSGVESLDEALRLRAVDQTAENGAAETPETQASEQKNEEPRTARGKQTHPASEPQRRAEADPPRDQQEDEAIRVAAISSL